MDLRDDEEAFRAAYAARFGERPLRPAEPPAAVLAGFRRRGPDHGARLPCDLSGLNPFQQAVLAKAAEIPYGEVRPYSWLAAEVGHRAAIRATGTALARNPVPVLIPCHRVVRADGRIGEYAFGGATKARLLAAEGVDVDGLAELAARGMRYVGSRATAVYCLPTCTVGRRVGSGGGVTFRNARDAAADGYRPCRRCRPVPRVSSTS